MANYQFLLQISNLWVGADNKEILRGVDLAVRPNEVQILLGPNASGKSTLAQVIAGSHRECRVSRGRIYFNGEDITCWSAERRAGAGIALAWQYPPSIPEVRLAGLLEQTAKNHQYQALAKHFEVEPLLNRGLNVDLSGGEKKISELLQIIALNPKLAIFDEIDSGLDTKKIEEVAKIIRSRLIKQGAAVIFITHGWKMLKFLRPQITNVMLGGKIICRDRDYRKVLRTIQKHGYEKCRECPLLADRQ